MWMLRALLQGRPMMSYQKGSELYIDKNGDTIYHFMSVHSHSVKWHGISESIRHGKRKWGSTQTIQHYWAKNPWSLYRVKSLNEHFESEWVSKDDRNVRNKKWWDDE